MPTSEDLRNFCLTKYLRSLTLFEVWRRSLPHPNPPLSKGREQDY